MKINRRKTKSRKVENLTGSGEQSKTLMRKAEQTIGEGLVQALIDTIPKIRALQNQGPDLVYDGPFEKMDNIMRNLEELHKKGYFKETYDDLHAHFSHAVHHDPQLLRALCFKNNVGEVRDFAIDFVIFKLVRAFKEENVKKCFVAVKDILDGRDIYAMDNQTSAWSARGIMKRYGHIKREEILNIEAALAEEYSVIEGSMQLEEKTYSLDVGPRSAANTKLTNIFNTTKVAFGVSVGKQKLTR